MIKLFGVVLLLMVEFVIINQILIPGLGCGIMIGELLSLFAVIVLIVLNVKLISNLYKQKK